ncbi:hypothetical protein VCV18_002071 [Metarhizium anisopliae]
MPADLQLELYAATQLNSGLELGLLERTIVVNPDVTPGRLPNLPTQPLCPEHTMLQLQLDPNSLFRTV